MLLLYAMRLQQHRVAAAMLAQPVILRELQNYKKKKKVFSIDFRKIKSVL